jgi:hypothetical protein
MRERVDFVEERDCVVCASASDCPFFNLRGCDDEGEFKDKPRFIVSNLSFVGEFEVGRVALVSIDDRFRSVIPQKAPVYVEYIPAGVGFVFEVILMAEGARFQKEVEEAVKVSLKFHGWGGFSNEGFGRGEVVSVERRGFDEFERSVLKPSAEKISSGSVAFEIKPLLILDKDGGGFYTSVVEEGFLNKLCNSVNERYWQFYGKHVHIQEVVRGVLGRARSMRIRGWSMKSAPSNPVFSGLGGELVFELVGVGGEYAKALALARFGIGRYKNQGFGSLIMKGGENQTATL